MTAPGSQNMCQALLGAPLRDCMMLSIMVNGVNVLLFLTKVTDLEELIMELKVSLLDRQLLLRSAFDATCNLRVEQGGGLGDFAECELLSCPRF